jgi:poly(A) polymerase
MATSLDIPNSSPMDFALDVVRRLRDAGFQAVWAGGCVRDALLGIPPKDYDVATSARPDEVTQLFGTKRTISVGACFGVIIVLGKHKPQGQVEVATFRSDGRYSDGRRPDHVEFCSAEQDALRRDFTINGMFYDPDTNKTIDYVGGQQDLKQGIVRAIGNPHERLAEDKLRMLRAVRFAARFNFALDTSTADAVGVHAADLNQVSVERITNELRQMLRHPSRSEALRLLVETNLFQIMFPHTSSANTETAARLFPKLKMTAFEPALTLLLHHQLRPNESSLRSRTATIADRCREFKLSNTELDTICWLSDSIERFRSPEQLPLHKLKPILANPLSEMLMDVITAAVTTGLRPETDLQFLEAYLEQTTPESLAPMPLITGNDLKSLGVESGPEFSRILRTVRNAQLDELIHTRDEALSRVRDMH